MFPQWKTTVLRNGRQVITLNPPLEKTLLWHITYRCNQNCKYCYGSFEGGSYKENLMPRDDVPLRFLLRTVEDLTELGFKRAHICGGEPFLRKDIWRFLAGCSKNGLESFVLSNGVFIPKPFSRYFVSGIFTNLSFSLDSLNRIYNDWVRGHTDKVIKNIEGIASLKRRFGVSTELGLYVVVTKKNLLYINELVDWAVDIGLNYVSLQLIYLPRSHPFYKELVITKEFGDDLRATFEHLHKMEKRCRIPGRALFELTKQFIFEPNLSVLDCFCDQDLNYLFIDGYGNVRRCPSKHIQPDGVLGNIREMRLRDMHLQSLQNREQCLELTPDCIGVWEMAHPHTFEIRTS